MGDLDRKLRSVLAAGAKIESEAHWADARRRDETGTTMEMRRAHPLGEEHFDRPLQELLGFVSEKRVHLSTRKYDASGSVADNDRIGCRP